MTDAMREEAEEQAARAYLLGDEIMKVVLAHSRDDRDIALNALTNILGTVILNYPDPSAMARRVGDMLVAMVRKNLRAQ